MKAIAQAEFFSSDKILKFDLEHNKAHFCLDKVLNQQIFPFQANNK
jgi:hypothetical protein